MIVLYPFLLQQISQLGLSGLFPAAGIKEIFWRECCWAAQTASVIWEATKGMLTKSHPQLRNGKKQNTGQNIYTFRNYIPEKARRWYFQCFLLLSLGFIFCLFIWGGGGCGRKCLGLSCFFCCLKKAKGLLPSPETSRSSSLTPLSRFTSTHFLYCYTSVIKMAQFVHTESQWIPFQGKKKKAKEHHLHPSVN